MARIMTVGMGKGGVGKSLLAFHLAHAAAAASGGVLALDLDRQGSLLSLLGVPPAQDLAGVLAGFAKLDSNMPVSAGGGIRVLRGDVSLAAAESMLVMRAAPPSFLRDLLGEIVPPNGCAVLDTATGGYLSEMALAAADVIVAPVAMRTADAAMLAQFLERAKKLAPHAEVLVVPNRFDRRTKVSTEVYAEANAVAERWGAVWSPFIPETVELDSARLGGQPVWAKQPHTPIARLLHNVADTALRLAGVLEPA